MSSTSLHIAIFLQSNSRSGATKLESPVPRHSDSQKDPIPSVDHCLFCRPDNIRDQDGLPASWKRGERERERETESSGDVMIWCTRPPTSAIPEDTPYYHPGRSQRYTRDSH